MTLTEHGKVHNGGIVFSTPLPLADGTEVKVQVESVTAPDDVAIPPPDSEKLSPEDFLSLPFFGMWADREDMKDSAAWVRKQREKWQQRAQRRD